MIRSTRTAHVRRTVAIGIAVALGITACGGEDQAGDATATDGSAATDDASTDGEATGGAETDGAETDGTETDGTETDEAATDVAATDCAGMEAPSGEVVEVDMVVFNPPSLGAFLPAVIDEREMDQERGLDITFVGRPPDAYNTEFASGQYPLGGSAALLSEGLRQTRGVEVAYLFNIFDYFGAAVSTTDEVTELADLPGHSLAAATTTTNYAMFQWFAQQQGVSIEDVTIQNTAPPGLIAQALTGRSDVVQLWEPAYSQLLAQGGDDLTTLDLGFEAWEEQFGFSDIPYLGVAAQQTWIDENEEIIPDLQCVYEDAATWILDNPAEAAEIIAATIPEGDAAVIEELIANNDRLGLNVQGAAEVADAIRAVFQAGMDIGYFEQMPDDSVIYGAG